MAARAGDGPAEGPGRAVWLVDGDDPVLVADQVRALVRELLDGEDPGFAVEDLEGEEIDLAAVADACRTPPMFGTRRVVIVRNVGSRSTEDLAPILAYLEDPSPTTALVLVAGGGRPAPKLVAAVKAHGHVVATAVASRDARAWVRDRVRASPIHLDAGGGGAGESATWGRTSRRLSALLEVLVAAYGAGGRLGADDVEPYLGEAGSVGSVGPDRRHRQRQDVEVALPMLHRLLAAGDRHPLVLLAILHRHVQSMLRVDHPDIRTEAQAAAAMGIAKRPVDLSREEGPGRCPASRTGRGGRGHRAGGRRRGGAQRG